MDERQYEARVRPSPKRAAWKAEAGGSPQLHFPNGPKTQRIADCVCAARGKRVLSACYARVKRVLSVC